MSSEDRVHLTVEQALSVLTGNGDVHTFRNVPGVLIGADWRREAIKRAIHDAKAREVGGAQCRAMGHGLVLTEQSGDVLFVECDDTRLGAFDVPAAAVAKAG